MKRQLHILIDNTFPKRLVQELGDFWRSSFPEWTIRHETDIAKANTRDLHWIPRLKEIQSEGKWLIVTADIGKNDRRRGDKLPVLCRKHGHAYLVVSDSISKFNQYKSAFSVVWEKLPMVTEACQKLKNQAGHVTLARLSLKGGLETYRIQFRNKSLEDWMAEWESLRVMQKSE